MHRRLALALAATAAIGLPGLALAPAAGAAKKIRIVGGEHFKPGKYLKINMRFNPTDVTVRSGSTVKVVNKASEEPHTITFVRKRFLPTSFDVAVGERLLVAHQVDRSNPDAPPGVFVVDNGLPVAPGARLQADTGFTPDVDGDSAFIAPGQKTFTFDVSAKNGSRLFYFCAIHPWMQGKIKVN